jgi:hypothetical protein
MEWSSSLALCHKEHKTRRIEVKLSHSYLKRTIKRPISNEPLKIIWLKEDIRDFLGEIRQTERGKKLNLILLKKTSLILTFIRYKPLSVEHKAFHKFFSSTKQH